MSKEDELRAELELKFLFLHFVYVVAPGALHDDSFSKILEETKAFVCQSTLEEFLAHVDSVSRRLDNWIKRSVEFLPIKVSVEEIAREFGRLLKEQGDNLYSNGVTFGWLNRLIDCTPLGLRRELPYHTRIGLAVHAGQGSVEEAVLLHDAFFLMQITKICHERLNLTASRFTAVRSTDKDYYIISTANQNVGSVARICVFSFYAFVEAFVNSTGIDFAARNTPTLTADETAILHGKKKGRYLSLEKKMELFQRIIRSDRKNPIVLTDSRQRKGPFITFLSNIKEVRDASAHFSTGKASIGRSPQEWIDFVELTSKISVAVASKFWEACYPGRHKPDYLLGLDYVALRDFAKERLDTTKHILTGADAG